jgi:DNA-binding transcriptional ArsR family regulator
MSHDDRRITDSKVLAAMAHPLRRRLLDVLKVHGPATVSALAEHTDQAVGNVSHHMKVLAGAKLVEQAPELANDLRERWWRLRVGSISWSPMDFDGDPAAAAVEQAATSLNLDRQASIVRAWLAKREGYDAGWVEAYFATESWLHLSANELAELSAEVQALLNRWSEREPPDDGQLREPVFIFAHGVPAQP